MIFEKRNTGKFAYRELFLDSIIPVNEDPLYIPKYVTEMTNYDQIPMCWIDGFYHDIITDLQLENKGTREESSRAKSTKCKIKVN